MKFKNTFYFKHSENNVYHASLCDSDVTDTLLVLKKH